MVTELRMRLKMARIFWENMAPSSTARKVVMSWQAISLGVSSTLSSVSSNSTYTKIFSKKES